MELQRVDSTRLKYNEHNKITFRKYTWYFLGSDTSSITDASPPIYVQSPVYLWKRGEPLEVDMDIELEEVCVGYLGCSDVWTFR
jgi:hypothetical protein